VGYLKAEETFGFQFHFKNQREARISPPFR